MIIQGEKNTQILAEIWLECSLNSHDFIDPGYWQENFGPMRDVYLPSADNYSIRAEPDGEILGFISLTGEHIEALFIRPAHQGKGSGRRLLHFASRTRDRMTVTVYERNQKAVLFYRSYGFIPVRTGTDSSTGETEIHMEWWPAASP